MNFYTISIQGVRIPYFELLPSISITQDDVLFSWLFWGVMIRWEKVDVPDEE